MRFVNFIYRLFDNIIVAIITVLALYNGQATLFYLLYLFLWEEIIRQVTFYSMGRTVQKSRQPIKALFPGFLLSILYFFMVSFFYVWLLNMNNPEYVQINEDILYFKNPYLIWSLIIFTLQLVVFSFINRKNVKFEEEMSPTNRRYFILHISVVLGGIILVFLKILGSTIPDDPFMEVLLPSLPFLVLRATVNTGFEFPKRRIF